MPFGTACGKLRKFVMFQLVQQTGRDRCFVCEKKITSADEFTIEHKIPWLDDNPDLFWDLNNIAFSHGKCNKAQPSRKIGPKGKSWCYGCKSFLSENMFGNRSSRWNNLDYECKSCKAERISEWYKNKHKAS
ncbi:hypothetical protein LCGC14_2403420 [marine sediment metagenome]|uniref:HNH domain-containing protein n=1 Tax=marine sediment metagenome TaxID=412755 RepID=A0A0F9BUL8_9ZZZZ